MGSVKTGIRVETVMVEPAVSVEVMAAIAIVTGVTIKIMVSITPRPMAIVASSTVIVVVVVIGHQTRNCRKHSNRSDEITELVPFAPHIASIPVCAVTHRFRVGQWTKSKDHQQDRGEHIYRISFFMCDPSYLLDFVFSSSHISGWFLC